MATLDGVRREAEALSEGVARALLAAHAGLAEGAALQPLYAAHARAHDLEALALAREAWAARDPTARLLAEWIAETHAARALAALDERELAWEARATARLDDGRVVEYARLPLLQANAADAGERARLERARLALVRDALAPLRRERLAREHDAVHALGIADGYLPTFEALSGIALEPLAAQGDALLRDTQAAWDEVLPAFARRRLGMAPHELARGDVLRLFRAPEFDAAFPAGGMVATVRTQLDAMGLDPTAGGRVTWNVGERAGKRARAFCSPVRVPDEVWLVLRPLGGVGDWRTLLHEVGHALHFAHVDRALPFEARWAGDNSVTEGYAMLFDNLIADRGWLRRYAGLDAAQADAFRRAAAFQELYFLRRYAAKLRYELALHADGAPADELEERYATTLTAATGVRHDPADAFVDVDPRLYVVRYLRAWQLQAVLGDALRERFDEDWWRNPRAGPWLASALLARGQRDGAEAVAASVGPAGGAGAAALDFAPLVRGIERALG